MSINFHGYFIRALVKRDLWKYFTNPTGYVFITLFIFLSAAGAFWQDAFFQSNLASLDQLNAVFPYLLAFFVPALTMTVWSEEKKQATDELLLTLPATSLDVVAGKYLATLIVYTVALALSLSHVVVLLWLGAPDLGLMFGNYVGYWLLGAAMIGVGMLASLLTANATVAFIVGALFCSLLAFGPDALAIGEALGSWVAPLGVSQYFEDFATGVVSLSGLLYFASLAGIAIYLNVLVVDSRHWPGKLDHWPTWTHHAVRVAALVVAVIAVNALVGRAGVRLDVTAEGLHSLSDETRQMVSGIPDERPVFIHAYVSPEVPEQYVEARENLLGVLREIDLLSGGRVEVLIEDTDPFTEEARAARETFGITPRQVASLASGRTSLVDVFMGIAFTSGSEEEVIPFLDRGLSAEYEITRSIRVVSNAERRRVGIVRTGLDLTGGLDFQTGRNRSEWSVATELRKQYEVVDVDPGQAIDPDLDAILVAQPSTLTEPQMDRVRESIEGGMPALLLVDPLPVIDVSQAPSAQGGGMNPLFGVSSPPADTGDIRSFLAAIGISWSPAEIAWDAYNPHPDLAHLAEEVVFVAAGNQNGDAFNASDPTTRSLQELVFLYPGYVTEAPAAGLEFEPLVRSGLFSGALPYFQLVQQTIFGTQLNPNAPHNPDGRDYVFAAHVRGTRPGVEEAGAGIETAPDAAAGEGGPETAPESIPAAEDAASEINVIVVADVDFVSEQFFDIRAEAPASLNFDNVTFFLNAIDSLVDEPDFIELRSKRPQYRTLERVEERTRGFLEARLAGEEQADASAEQALEEAQQRLDARVEAVRQRDDLDTRTKEIMARNLEEAENRRFAVLEANIERDRDAEIAASQEEMEAQVLRIQNNIKTFAVLLPPLPVLAVGVLIFFRRRRREREGVEATRRFRGA